MTEFGHPARPSRRRVLAAFGGASAIAWSAPQIVATSRAGAATTYVITADVDCTITDDDGFPGTLDLTWDPTGLEDGGPITINNVGCTFLDGTGSGVCDNTSPPTPFTNSGSLSNGNRTLTFPEETAPPGLCIYLTFELTVSCIS